MSATAAPSSEHFLKLGSSYGSEPTAPAGTSFRRQQEGSNDGKWMPFIPLPDDQGLRVNIGLRLAVNRPMEVITS